MSALARDGAEKTPFLRTSNVFWDEIDLSKVDEMSIPLHELKTKLLEPGDLLVCEGGEIGRAAIWNGEVPVMSFQNHLHRLRPLIDDIEPRFFVYFLQAAFTQLGIFEGAGNKTTIPNLSRNRLAALEVPHPQIDEQRLIVAALARARTAISVHDRSTATAHELKRAAMRQLFTKGLRGEAQKDTEIGPVPESWESRLIGDLGLVITGNTPPTKDPENYVGGQIPFVSPGDIEHGAVVRETEKRMSPKGLSASRPISSGTTCFVCIGSTIGKVGFVEFETCATNQQINSVVPKTDEYHPKYLFYLLTYWSEHIRKQASPSPVPILSKGAFEQIEIFTSVHPDEQLKIAQILDAIDAKIDLHRRKRDVLDELFNALLHKLMTGEIRVADLDLSALQFSPAKEAAA